MMEIEEFSETLVFSSTLTRLITREYFSTGRVMIRSRQLLKNFRNFVLYDGESIKKIVESGPRILLN
jgi:hypothetical protein